MRRWVLAAFVVVISHSAQASKLSSSEGIVVLVGEISTGDADRFASIVSQLGSAPHPILLLNSPGGKVIEALRIGEILRQRGIYTAVVGGSTCASACSLIRVAGETRFADHTSKVGFHAAYTGEATDNHMDGAGNALIGSYLARLGLSDRAIYFATSAPPDTINWLPTDGSIVEIPYKFIENPFAETKPQPVTSPQSTQPQIVKPAEPVATAHIELMKPNSRDHLYPHELVASEPFKRAYKALFAGHMLPDWLLAYQETLNGVEMPVWSIEEGTTTYEGFRVCQPHNCNDTWIDVIFTDRRAFALTWAGGKPTEWWGQPDDTFQHRLLNEGNPSAIPPALPAGYVAGRQARIAYETWFSGLTNSPFKEGAQFWATNRSLRQPPTCQQQTENATQAEWEAGCLQAQKLPGLADLRRKNEPNFHWGWNTL